MTVPQIFNQKSPFQELDRIRRKRLIEGSTTIITWSSAGAGFLYTVLWLTSPSTQAALAIFFTFFSAVICIIAKRIALRHDNTELASFLLLISLLIVIGITALIISGLSPVIAPAYGAIIVLAGMLLGPTGSLIFAGISFVFWLLSIFIVNTHLITPTPIPDNLATITLSAITGMSFLFIALMSRLSTEDLRQALGDATYDLTIANRELEKANQLKSQFMARTSHELRTPLNSIIGFTDLALREIYGPLTDLQTDGLRRVIGNAKRLLVLINDILDLSKIEAGELTLFEDEVSIRKIIETINITHREMAYTKGLDFSMTVTDSMPDYIIGDENRLMQIMTNLVDNAIKYTDEGSVVVEIAPYNNHKWHIKVQDTGQGIREDDYDSIFEEFRQVGTPQTEGRQRGAGLGLSITKHLVKLMGGEIVVNSRLGHGSVFDVILPLSTPTTQKVQITPDGEQNED